MHDLNSFLTLTYDDASLPEYGDLAYKDFQDFMKLLRHDSGPGLKFFMCGEYGETTQRPHYHCLLFGHDFADKKAISRNGGNTLYTSERLGQLWKLGHHSIGQVSFKSAAYTARYALKKVNGDNAQADAKYLVVDWTTGEILHEKRREFTNQSNGIGLSWLQKYHQELLVHDVVHIGDKTSRIPRYYMDWLEEHYPEQVARNRRDRKSRFRKHKKDTTSKRLRERELVHRARMGQLVRML